MKGCFKTVGFLIVISIAAITCLNGLMSNNYLASFIGMAMVFGYLFWIFKDTGKK